MFLPLYKTSESSKKERDTVVTFHKTTVDVPKVVVGVGGMSVEDIVNRVLESTKLTGMINSVSSQNTAKNQPTSEEINVLVK